MIFNSKKNEQGVALLISLGMLSLLLVIIISFIFTARIDLMVSSFHVDDAAAKSFSRDSNIFPFSSLQAGGAKMPKIQQLKQAGKNTSSWPLAYDYTSDSVVYGNQPNWSKGAVSKFEDEKDGNAIAYNLGFMATPEVKDIKSTSLSSNGESNFAWWHDFSRNADSDIDGGQIDWSDEITGNSGNVTGNTMSQNTYIAGRYMYLMTDESIKFDLNGIIHNKEHDFLHSNFYDLEKMFEYFNLDKGALTKGLETLPELNGKKRFWESWRHIWNYGCFAKEPKYPTLSEENKAREAYNLFTPYSYPTGEFMYYIPKNLGNKWTERRFIHRYFVGNLASADVTELVNAPESYQSRYDFFDTTKFPDGKGQQVAAVLEQVFDREKNSGDETMRENRDVKFIPWLAHISSDIGDKNSDYGKQVQKQVAANLIDYTDSGSTATTDYNSIETTDKIEYCGLEKSPYIQGVNITVTFTPGIEPDGSHSTERFKIKEVKAKVQLANIYSEGLSADVEFKAMLDGEKDVISSSSKSASCGSNSTSEVETKAVQLLDKEFKNMDTLKFEKFVIELRTGGALSDVAMLKNLGKGEIKNLAEGAKQSLLVEFRDSRCNNYLNFSGEANHLQLYAKTYDKSWEEGTGAAFTPIQMSNDFYDSSKNLIDRESSPLKPSTAFIRDEQITTLWELGCIHRGEPWRTINLKSSCKVGQGTRIASQHGKISGPTNYNNNMSWENSGYAYTGAYALGDAALLNQLKLTTQIETYPCINVFNPNKKYWDFIFDKVFQNEQVTMNKTYTEVSSKVYPAKLKTKLTNTDKTAFLETIKRGGNSGISPGPGYNKNHIASQIGDKEGLWSIMYNNPSHKSLSVKPGYDSKKDDLYAEELIGKLADQVKINFNLYRYVSTYQKLAYMPAAQSEVLNNISQQDQSDPRLNGYVKLELLGESDVREDSWFKIMGQQKMMTIMKRPKDTGRFEILENTVLESF